MNFEMDMEDYTIILNALHYYKKVEKRGNFKQYDEERINKVRDKLASQVCHTFSQETFTVPRETLRKTGVLTLLK
jgi:NAD+--asparagine ADP-ribosyltransferase